MLREGSLAREPSRMLVQLSRGLQNRCPRSFMKDRPAKGIPENKIAYSALVHTETIHFDPDGRKRFEKKHGSRKIWLCIRKP